MSECSPCTQFASPDNPELVLKPCQNNTVFKWTAAMVFQCLISYDKLAMNNVNEPNATIYAVWS